MAYSKVLRYSDYRPGEMPADLAYSPALGLGDPYVDPSVDPSAAVDRNPYGAYSYSPYVGPPRATAGTFSPNTDTKDINRMWRDNRTDAIDEADTLGYDLRGRQDYYGGLEGNYRGAMNAAYGDLQQTPGYTAEEAAAITREPYFNSLRTPDDQFASLNPSDEETSRMTGDVGSYDEFFDQDLQRQIDTNAANMQRGQVAQTRGELQGALDAQESAYGAAIDPGKLGLSGEYGRDTSDILRGSVGEIRGALDPNRLRYDQATADRSRITDQDVRDWQAQAGNTVRNRYAAAKDAITQGAAAQGNPDAMAIAAARGRMENQEAVGAADAITDARVKARMAQTGRNMELEDARLAAERGYSGLKTANEQDIAGRELAQANTGEQLRLSANRDISNRQMEAAGTVGANRLGAYKYTGSLGTGVEQGIGEQEAGTQRNISAAGTAIRQAQDVAATNRAANLYGARRANAQYGIDTKFGQGMAVGQQVAGASQAVANARRAGEQEGRGWLTGQTDSAQQAGESATRNRLALYGARTGAMNQATSGLSNWEIGNQGNSVLSKIYRGMDVTGNFARNMSEAGKNALGGMMQGMGGGG